jgi:hypothetical protein
MESTACSRARRVAVADDGWHNDKKSSTKTSMYDAGEFDVGRHGS